MCCLFLWEKFSAFSRLQKRSGPSEGTKCWAGVAHVFCVFWTGLFLTSVHKFKDSSLIKPRRITLAGQQGLEESDSIHSHPGGRRNGSHVTSHAGLFPAPASLSGGHWPGRSLQRASLAFSTPGSPTPVCSAPGSSSASILKNPATTNDFEVVQNSF